MQMVESLEVNFLFKIKYWWLYCIFLPFLQVFLENKFSFVIFGRDRNTDTGKNFEE